MSQGARSRGQIVLLKKSFLESFRFTGNITESSEAVGIHRNTITNWKEHDDEFLIAYQQSEIESTERMEKEARKRAVRGTRKPVFHQGRIVGYVREKSDTLLIFLLKARAPDKYRERLDLKHGGQIEHVTMNAARQVLRVNGGTDQ